VENYVVVILPNRPADREHCARLSARSPSSSEARWSALIGVRRNVHLLVEGDNRSEEVWIELWSREPERSDGLAVTVGDDDLLGIAPIPLCGCGDRGCGNVGLQLTALIAAENLAHLVELLRGLPDVAGPPKKGSTWDGDFSGGVPSVD